MLPFILAGAGAFAGGLGAFKLVTTTVAAAKFLAMQLKAWKTGHDAELGIDPEGELEARFIRPGSLPGHPELEGEWLLTAEETERFNAAWESISQGYISKDLEKLKKQRAMRNEDAALQLWARPKFEEMKQKQVG